MKNTTEKQKREDDKQSTDVVKLKNFIKFEQYIPKGLKLIVKNKEIPHLLNYLKLNPHLKTLTVQPEHNGLNESISLLTHNNSLTKLFIDAPDDGDIIDEGFSALALNKSLTSLGIVAQNVTLTGLQSLLQNDVLKRFELELFDDDQKDFDKVIEIMSTHPTLTELSLKLYLPLSYVKNSKITPKTYSFFLNNRVLNTLKLDVPNDECLRILSSHPTLTSLTVISRKITSKGVAFLLNNKTLKSVVFESSPLGDEGADLLSKHPTLTSLGLKNCKIGDKGAIALASNSCLTYLNLHKNIIGFWGFMALARNQTLTQLHLFKTESAIIPPVAWMFLFGNQTLRELTYKREFWKREKRELEVEKYVKSNLGVRNSQLQNQYDDEVKGNLVNHLPPVLVNVVQGYSKGEYPYRYQLFYQSPFVNTDEMQLALPQIIKYFSDIEKACTFK